VSSEWKAAAQIYNSAVATWAIAAAWELGALDELRDSNVLDSDEFAAQHHLDRAATLGMFRALSAVQIVKRNNTKIAVGPHFTQVFQTRSFFHWLARGSAELFRQIPSVIQQENRVGDYYSRDPAAIAFACREINELCYDPWFWQAVGGLEHPYGVVADLGCGSGQRLREMLTRYPGMRGIGVDIAPDSLADAEQEASAAGLADRLRFIQADVLSLEACGEFEEVELLTCFMMGHDLWPRERCISTLRRIRDVFPRASCLLLGDATSTDDKPDDDLPVFRLGFEFAHDLMGKTIPSVGEWEDAIKETGWELRGKHLINMTVGEVILHLGRS
jgi:phenylpyruvate C(3)-methyltransferase